MTETNHGCEYGPLLSLLHDGELPADRAREVQEHVRTCPACAAELEAMRRLSGAFSGAKLPPPPPSLMSLRPDAAAPRMRLAAGTDETREPDREPRHLRIMRVLTAVAAVIFFIAVAGMLYQRYRPRVHTVPGGPGVEKVQNPHGTSRPSDTAPRPEPADYEVRPRQQGS